MRINFNQSGQPQTLAGKVIAAVIGAVVLIAALMFSLVFFAVVAVLGVCAWAVGTRCISTSSHRIYESLRAANTGNDPTNIVNRAGTALVAGCRADQQMGDVRCGRRHADGHRLAADRRPAAGSSMPSMSAGWMPISCRSRCATRPAAR